MLERRVLWIQSDALQSKWSWSVNQPPGLSVARLVLILVAFIVVLQGQVSFAQTTLWPAPPRDDRNASFWHRVDHPPADPLHPPLVWYEPLATLKGRPGPFLPIARINKHAFDPQTVQMATSFADLTNSDTLMVAHRGIVQIEHYGGAAGPDHRFSAHSMTRVLGAIALGILVDRGKIRSIDEPASLYLPEWRGDARRDITIRQLLTMSSGLSTNVDTAAGSPYMQGYYGSDIEKIVANAPLTARPGTTFAYDLHNNHALALIIERVAREPYIDFISRNIWQRLGADDAAMLLDRPDGRVMSYCCLISTPRNWMRVGELLRLEGAWHGRTIVSARWVRQMLTPSVTNPNFGFQLFLGSAWFDPRINRQAADQAGTLERVNSSNAFYFSGAGDINVMVLPDRAVTIVRTGVASRNWRYHVIPNLLVAALGGEPLSGEWDTLYRFRMALPKPPAATLAQSGLSYWPLAAVRGSADARPLLRTPFTCNVDAGLSRIDAQLAKGGSYGLLIYQEGAIRHEHYAGNFEASTLGEPASMHKSVMALLVGRAVDDGAIAGIDLPISQWLPEWSADARGHITLRNLLQMASGLDPVLFEPGKTGGKSSLLLSGTRLEDLVLSLTYKEPPGRTFEYFSHVSELIALVLQRATGEPYASYLRRILWTPMGGHDAYVALDRPSGLAKTYASLLAVPEDWVRIGRIFLRDGLADDSRVVSAAWIRSMVASSPANPNYGFQIWRGSPHLPDRVYSTSKPNYSIKAAEPFLADDMVYFDGAGGRRVYISKSEDLVIVRMGDADPAWDDSWLPNAVVSVIRSCRR